MKVGVMPGARRRATILLGFLLILAAVPVGRDWLAARPALADNGLTITKEADGDPLIGGEITYTVTVRNDNFPAGPNNPDGKAYNLDIVDQLPPNVRFVSSPTGSPTLSYTGTAPNIRQTITFSNLTDVARNQTITLKYTATLAPQPAGTPPSPGVTTPGTVLDNSATALVSNDPRAAATIPAGTATDRTTALPFDLDKETVQSTGVGQDTGGCPPQGTGAGRGFSYKLTARNNAIGPSTNVVVVDTLPYGVDYCGTASGPSPTTVVRNADGTTTLTYNLGALITGQDVILSPSVAIPYVYPTEAPITNPLRGTVIPDATVFTNSAVMTGTYSGTNYSTGTVTSRVTGKYATIAKSGTPSEIAYGTVVNYSLTPSTSTNYNISQAYIIDTLPDGQDYNLGSSQIGGTPFPPTTIPAAVYTPCASATSPAAGVYLCPDGTTVLTYGPINNTVLTPTTAGTQFTIGFTATVRATYRGTGAPVLATDKLSNAVDITYNADSIPGLSPATSVQRAGGGAIDSSTGASQTTRPPSLIKQVVAVARADGSSPPAAEGNVAADLKSARAAIGDLVTFRLIYTGSPDADQQDIAITDFLPPGYRYVAGSSRYSGTYTGTVNDQAQGSNPDPACAAAPCPTGGLLFYDLTGDAGSALDIVGRNQTLTIEFQAQITPTVPATATGTIQDNLGKFTGVNTAGEAYSGRDRVTITLLAPTLAITKTNDAPNPSFGNQTFNYTITIRNTGNSTAYRIADLVDTLPADIRYNALVSITPAGGAAAPGANAPTYAPGGTGYGGTLTFTGLSALPPGATVTIVYQAQLNSAPSAGATVTNTARIGSITPTPVPSNYSQPSGAVASTQGPVQATSNVRIGGQALTKTATLVTPQVNGTGGRVTIGDRVNYTLTYTIPANVTVTNGQLRECLPLGFQYAAGSYSGTVSGGSLPGFPLTEGAGFSPDNSGTSPCPSGQQYLLINTGSLANTGGAITVTASFQAVITGVDRGGTQRFTTFPGPNNRRVGGAVNSNINVAYFYNDATQIASASTGNHGPSTTADNDIYIPNLTLTKSLSSPSSPSAGGVTVSFLIRLSNTGGSTAYNIANLVDTLDPGLTFLAAYESNASCALTTPLTPLSAVGQTVTLPAPASLANGANYYVCLQAALASNVSPGTAYTNTVTLGAGGTQYSSAPASNTARRDFSGVPQAQAAITTSALSATKSVVSGRPSANGEAVPGEVVTFRLQFVIPAGTTLYSPVVTDNFDFSAAGARLGAPSDTTPAGLLCTNGVVGAYTFAVTGGRATYTFAGDLANPGATASTCVVQFDTRVLNRTGAGGNNAGGAIANSFSVAYRTSAGSNATPVSSQSVNVTIREPNVTLAKSAVSSYSATTGQATFRLTLTNAVAPTSAAYDLTVADTLPAGLVYVSNTAPTGGAGVTNPAVSVVGNTITFTVDSLATGAGTSVDIVVRGDGTAGAGAPLTNTANLIFYDLPAAINNTNAQNDPNSRRRYDRSDAAAITPPAPTFTKAPATQTITIGANVNFTLALSVPAGTALYSVTIGDTLPAGLVLTGSGITLGPLPGNGCGAPSATGGGGTSPLTLGTIANPTGAACAYTIAVAARSDGTVPAVGVGSATVTNTGTLGYSTTVGGTTTTTQATAAVTIQAPVLSFTKAVSPTGPVATGATLTYTLTFANSGPVAATDAQIIDTYATGTTVVPGSISNGGVDDSANRTVTFNIGTIAAGTSGLTRTFQVVVNSLPTSGSVANTATLTTAERPPLTSGTTNGTTNLRVSKSVAPNSAVRPGATLTYTLTATNPSPATAPATGVVLSDPIPANTAYVANSASNGGGVSGGAVGWPAFDVAPGATVTRTFQVRVNSPLTNGTQISNAATFTSSQTPGNNAIPPVTTGVTSAPNLTLTKTNAPTGSLGVGGQITYTLRIENTGDENAENVTIADIVPADTTYLSATGAATYTAADRTVRWTIGTLAANTNASVTLTVAVNNDPARGQIAAGIAITNKGTYEYNNSSGGNRGQGESGTVTNATLSHALSKVNEPVEATRIAPGSTITYTLTYRNTGTGDLTNVVVGDPIPANTTFVSADNDGGESGGVVTWSLGTVPAGESRVLSFVVRAATPLPNGTVIENRASASAGGAASGTVPDVTSDTVRNRIASAPVFTVAKVNSPTTPVRSGDVLTYTLTVGNTGNENATNVTVADAIPNGTSYIGGTATGGTAVQDSGGTLTWTIGNLPVGTTTTLTFQVAVNATLPADSGGTPIDITNTARVTGSTETGTLDTPVSSDPVSNPTVGLRVAKTVTPSDGAIAYYGGTLTYGITYRNLGSLPLTAFTIVDDIPAGTTFIDADNGGGFNSAGANGRGRVAWNLGTLATGQEGTVTFRVRVDNPTTPLNLTIVNAATITANEVPATVVTNQTANPTGPAPINSLRGNVYIDSNNDGVRDPGEIGIGGVELNLTGTDIYGAAAARTVSTNSDGEYSFDNLLPGTYTIAESQPANYIDGKDTAGSLGGDAAANDRIAGIVLPADSAGVGYNFGERTASAPSPTPPPSASPTPRPTPSPSPSASPTPRPSTSPTPAPSAAPGEPTAPAEVDLVVTKTGPSTVALGETVVYTITIINRGPGNAFRAQLVDNVPAAISTVTWQCASTGQAACGAAGGSGNAISLAVTINAGSDNRITVTVIGLAAEPGAVSNTARVDPPGGSTERVPDDNTSATTTTIVGPGAPSPSPNPTPGPGASPVPSASPSPRPAPSPGGARRPDIQKVASAPIAAAGERIVFTITVTNPGPEPLTNLIVTDQVPIEFAVQGATSTRGTVAIDGQGVSVAVAALGPGESVTIAIETITTGGGRGTVINTATYTGTLGGQPVSGRAMAGVGIPTLPNTGGGGMATIPPRWIPIAALAALALLAAAAYRNAGGCHRRRPRR